jgi:type I restriction-modification system DNA methylase subunit
MNFTNTYSDEEKKENGVYYTPEDVSMVMSTRTKLFDDGKGVWLDPCCGLGILSISLASIQDDPVEFVKNRLIINEKDEKQLKIALSNFKEKFGVVPKSFNEDFLKLDIEIDYIIMNPPYFKYKDSDIYAYFIEKACKTTKGFISINPTSFTNGIKFKKIRKLLLKYSSITLYHFDNIPGQIFKDAKIRVSILCVHNENEDRKTTGQIRWKTKLRKSMFESLEDKLSEGIFNEDIFYKTFPNTSQYIKKEKKLNDYIVSHSQFPLFVSNSPRYFITASSQIMDRKGQIKIYFKDLDSFNKGFIMLNSSYLYWWWKISDSSLSLTRKTLLSLPWVDFDYNQDIINALIESEQINKVYKKNAGKLQENIKHPKELIMRLNHLFLDKNFIKLHD